MMSAVNTTRPDRRTLPIRRRYVSENFDSTLNREDFAPLGLQKPWVSVTKLFSSAHKRLSRNKSSSPSIRDDSSIPGPGRSKPPLLKTLSLSRQKHVDDNTSLQEFMKDVFHVMKHGTYPPAKGYATIVAELQQVLAVPTGPDMARRGWYGHLLPRLGALLTQPIKRISTLPERVPAALSLWCNLQGYLAPLLQAFWQPLPGMHAERDVVTVFRRCVLPLVSLRGADERQRNEVLANHRRRLVDMLLLCSRVSWCSEECCQQHNGLKDIHFEDQLSRDINHSLFVSSGNSGGISPRIETSSQSSGRKPRTAYRKTSAPSGYINCRTDTIEKIDEDDELVLQNHQQKHEVFNESKNLGRSLSKKQRWRKTSCPAHLATLSALDNDRVARELFGDGLVSERVESSTGIGCEGFGGSQNLSTEIPRNYTTTNNYDLSAELSFLFGMEDQTCGTAFVVANMASLLRLHHDKE